MNISKWVIKWVALSLALFLLAPGVARAERETQWLKGTIIGGSAGLAAGLATDGFVKLLDWTASTTGPNSKSLMSTGWYVGIPLIGAVVGGGVGALIGMKFQKKGSEHEVQIAPMIDSQTGTKGLMVQGSF